MFQVLRHAFLVLLLVTVISSAQPGQNGIGDTERSTTNNNPAISPTLSQVPLSSSRSTEAGNATCISRTANYITHTLPQQCLRTDRGLANGTHSTASSRHGSSPVSRTPASSTAVPESSALTSQETGGSVNNITYTANTTAEAVSPTISTTNVDLSRTAATSSASAAITESVVDAVQDPETDAESPLDNANFLSFEEWKKQNLVKAGQSPEHVGQERQPINANRPRPGINNALDTLGEESEIDLDFSGFGGARSLDAAGDQAPSSTLSEPTSSGDSSPASNTLRSKDAGKTCKERTNYASFDCAATVLKSNAECKHASSVLVENKDSYMLNTCSAKNKFFIVELCNDILIDTIVLANYEFFSSIFRHVRISVSDRYPVKTEKWKDLGTFEARSTRDVQAFLIENPLIWARYLRIEFLTHYGNEYYCPLSLLRVHGTTMMEEFRHQEELARGEISDDESVLEPEATDAPPVKQEASPSTDETEKATVQAMPSMATDDLSATNSLAATGRTSAGAEAAIPSVTESETAHHDRSTGATVVLPELEMPTLSEMTCAPTSSSLDMQSSSSGSNTSVSATEGHHEPTTSVNDSAGEVQAVNATQSVLVSISTPVVSRGNESTVFSTSTIASGSTTNLTTHGTHVTALPDIPKTASTTNFSSIAGQPSSIVSSGAPPVNSTRSITASSTSSHAPQPSTQDSFLKSMHKRLQQLESNSTLSLQYIEEQSRILRDAFNKVEKRQISHTTKFLSHLNETVMAELHGFRQAYDQLWQSTVIELESQREQYQREMLALSTRLTLVADELVWQKRMGIVQSTLLLLCLGLVLFARQGNGYLEMPLAQQLMLKSQAALRSGWESEPNSPSSPASRSPVALFRRKIWRSSTEPVSANGNISDATGSESRPGTRDGLEVQLEPPTPSSNGAQSDADQSDEDELYEDVLTTQSGPATPNGSGAGLKRPPEWPGGG